MIRLRAVEPQDADLFYSAENDMEAWPDSDTIAPLSLYLLKQYAENYKADPLAEGQLRLMIEDTDENQPVGILDLYDLSFIHGHSFIGIYILPQFRRRHFALQALQAGMDYARRRLGLRRLGAKILAFNTPSIDLFLKAGFSPAGILPGWHLHNGNPTDLHILITYIG